MLKKSLIFFFLALSGLSIQAVFIHSAMPSVVVPDLILVLVVFLGLFQRSVPGLFGAFLLGVLGDLASGVYLGPNALGAVSAFLLSGLIANRVYAEKAPAVFIITAFCSIVKNISALLLVAVYVRDNALWSPDSYKVLVFEALLCGLLAPFCFKLLSFFERQKVMRQQIQSSSLLRFG